MRFFEGRRHGQAVDDRVVQRGPGIRFEVMGVPRLRRRTLDLIASNLVLP